MSGLGDVNGDGIADFAIGAPNADVNGPNAGKAYVVFGKSTGLADIDLANLASGDGFEMRVLSRWILRGQRIGRG